VYVKTLKMNNSVDKLQYSVVNLGPFLLYTDDPVNIVKCLTSLNFKSVIYLGRHIMLKSSTVHTKFTTKWYFGIGEGKNKCVSHH